MASRVSSPILIGRSAELGQLTSALAAAATGAPRTILVGGEAGIGKSRLLNELEAMAAADGALVLRGATVSFGGEDTLPFAPIAEALRALGRTVEPQPLRELVGTKGMELARLVPALGSGDGVQDTGTRPEWAQTRIFEELLGLLGRLGEQSPVALLIEDLHWADRSTREVLSFVARNVRTERLLLVATFRTDDLHRRHPLRPWLAEMDRLRQIERIELTRLDRGAVAALLTSLRDSPPAPALVDEILRRSEGNPFFVEELVAAGAERTDSLPDSLRDVLLARVASLSDRAQWVLGLAAVAGRVVDHDLLAAAAEMPEPELTAALREAVHAQVLLQGREGSGDSYSFRHALLQEAVYDDLLGPDQRRFHAGFAAALLQREIPMGAEGAIHLAALAHHASAAHDLPTALRAWIDAARASTHAAAFHEAGHAYEHALELWDAVPPDARPADPDEIQLMHEGAWARAAAGDFQAAINLERRAVAAFDAAVDPTRGALLRERLARVSWLLGDCDEAMVVLDEAVALLAGLPPSHERAQVVGGLAAMMMLRGRHRPAIGLAEEAITIARAAGSRKAEAHATCTLGVALAMTGDCESGIRVSRDAMDLTRELGDVNDLGRCYSNLASVLHVCGDLEGSLAISTEGSTWSRGVGVWRTAGVFQESNAAGALIDLGRWEEADARLRELEEMHLEGVGAMTWATVAGRFAVLRGQLDKARGILERTRALAERLDDAQFTGPHTHGLVLLALAEHRLEDAWRLATQGEAVVNATDDPTHRAVILEDVVRVAAERAEKARALRDGVAEAAARREGGARVRMLEDMVSSYREESGIIREPRARLVTARAEATRLDGQSDPAAWGEAVLAWESLALPYPAAYARFRLAEALLSRDGERSAAAETLRDALAVARRLGAGQLRESIEGLARRARLDLDPGEPGGRVPHTTSDTATDAFDPSISSNDPFKLTGREREVLLLLVEGYTNRRIAEALFISESTAGVHVSNILGKLGVASRVEAAALAVRARLAG